MVLKKSPKRGNSSTTTIQSKLPTTVNKKKKSTIIAAFSKPPKTTTVEKPLEETSTGSLQLESKDEGKLISEKYFEPTTISEAALSEDSTTTSIKVSSTTISERPTDILQQFSTPSSIGK